MGIFIHKATFLYSDNNILSLEKLPDNQGFHLFYIPTLLLWQEYLMIVFKVHYLVGDCGVRML
jgi:hypothetical protein